MCADAALSPTRIAALTECRERLPADDEDHPLDTDITAAEQVIADLAEERAG